MYELFIVLAIFGGIIASITDFKNRWVPDYASYSLVLTGIIGHLIISVSTHSIWPIAYSVIGAALFYGLAVAMFYAGAWGGGDAKLLIGFGAALPLVHEKAAIWPFLGTLLLNVFIVGALYGIVYTTVKSFQQGRDVLKYFTSAIKKYKLLFLALYSTLLLPIITAFITPKVFLLSMLLWIMMIFLAHFAIISKIVDDHFMFKHLRPSQMDLGERLVDNVKIGSKVVYHPKLIGLEEKDLAMLRDLEEKGKISSFKVKVGVPYAPAFVFGLLVSIFYGDILYKLLMVFLV